MNTAIILYKYSTFYVVPYPSVVVSKGTDPGVVVLPVVQPTVVVSNYIPYIYSRSLLLRRNIALLYIGHSI
ncbi:MAG TPA: hypothetical protein EYH55_00880 [Methanothermococcus okinawensis]|uniref:Uncharacterized protein n=1 Tax=Methanothermococcus okinawensis TaxID=155863 RepID=A0A832ZXR0_9EURY|nr:hypothetical protein [Methanothermococcus okinawensis]